MSAGEKYVAFDLGAESGRVMLGSLAKGRLHLEEIHRFPNVPVQVLDSLHWDVLHLWAEMKRGLVRVVSRHGRDLAGIGLDGWGVDFALLDQRGALLGLPYHYRDRRTEGILGELGGYVSEWELYAQTGLSSLPISTLCQLLAMRKVGSPALDAAHALLMLPNLFTFWLSGCQVTEATIAGTTQLHDLAKRDWCLGLLEKLRLPGGLLREIVPTATTLGPLWPALAQEVGVGRVPVIATAGHDTAAAATAVPSAEGHFTFISSGTWSVIGTELGEPLISKRTMTRRFLNEIGACGRILFAHNSAGLWPVQQCLREWQQKGCDWSYADLMAMAGQARPFAAIVNPDDPAFFQPGNMTERIADVCRQTGQSIPSDPGSVIRSLLEGLALRYRQAVEDLEELTGRPTRAIHIVGGGSKNSLLCQLTADATQRTVLAGPAEATAMATVLLQALARGSLSSLEELRQVVSRSCDLVGYEPDRSAAWGDAYDIFFKRARREG